LIERAYTQGEQMGLAVWTQDEAGPFQTIPFPGQNWQEEGRPQRQPHEYVRDGTAKLLTLFHPHSGEVRGRGVTSCPNIVLHAWLKEELAAILATMSPALVLDEAANREFWQSWQQELQWPITLSEELPSLRMLLVLDNLAGHKTPEMVLWMFSQGVMPLYTPLGGSWLNMCESVQRIIKRRALECQHPQTTAEIIRLLEATVRGWNREPTPFEWGGKRAARRARSRQRRHAVGGSGACARSPVRRQQTITQQWQQACQTTH
jgi:hypothetical protein